MDYKTMVAVLKNITRTVKITNTVTVSEEGIEALEHAVDILTDEISPVIPITRSLIELGVTPDRAATAAIYSLRFLYCSDEEEKKKHE